MSYNWNSRFKHLATREPVDSPSALSYRGIIRQATAGLAALAALLWLALFLSSGSIDFWQAWVYWLTFVGCVTAISVYFLKKDLRLIGSRLKTGPGAESVRTQKVAQALISFFFILLIIIPSLDHRYHWSSVPALLVMTGDGFVAVGLLVIFLVFRENSHASNIIEVREGQKTISTGPYALVRHPMYAGALLMLFFTPLALGSYGGLLPFIPISLAIAFRFLEEEKFLRKNLPGYDEYCRKVRYHVIPFIW